MSFPIGRKYPLWQLCLSSMEFTTVKRICPEPLGLKLSINGVSIRPYGANEEENK